MADIFWSVLLERSVQEWAVSSLLNLAIRAGGIGAKRMILPYMRTDAARNRLVGAFLDMARHPDDVLIMLDCDHTQPQDILERLAAPDVGVVGALAFMRHHPHTPCFFFRGADGKLHAGAEWGDEPGLIECTMVGTGAIAIKRWVFDKLADAGMDAPYFRYTYPPNTTTFPTEDMYFGACCESAGVPHHVDTGLIIPHLTVGEIDESSWREWLDDNPGQISSIEKIGQSEIGSLDDALTALSDGKRFTPAEIKLRVDL